MKLNFGGNQGIRQRQASFELGPLYCSGKAKPNLQSSGYVNSSPTSCHDLLLKGVTQVLKMLLLNLGTSRFMVFCLNKAFKLIASKTFLSGWLLYGQITQREISKGHIL